MKNTNLKLINMNKVAKTALIIGGAVILGNSIDNCTKYKKIDEKLDHLTKHTVTHEWESTIEIMKETIDSLLLTEMDLGAKLDSCILSNENSSIFKRKNKKTK